MELSWDPEILNDFTKKLGKKLEELEKVFKYTPKEVMNKVNNFREELQQIKAETTRVRVMVLGILGAGKTSLLNGLVQHNIAINNPTIEYPSLEYENNIHNLQLIDTLGYEIGSKEYEQLICKCIKNNVPDILLLCLTENNFRSKISEEFITIIEKIQIFTKKEYVCEIPLILVQTKIDIIPHKGDPKEIFNKSHEKFMNFFKSFTKLNVVDHLYCSVIYYQEDATFNTTNTDNLLQLITKYKYPFMFRSFYEKRMHLARSIVNSMAFNSFSFNFITSPRILDEMLILITALSNSRKSLDSFINEVHIKLTLNYVIPGALFVLPLFSSLFTQNRNNRILLGSIAIFSYPIESYITTKIIGSEAIETFLTDPREFAKVS